MGKIPQQEYFPGYITECLRLELSLPNVDTRLLYCIPGCKKLSRSKLMPSAA